MPSNFLNSNRLSLKLAAALAVFGVLYSLVLVAVYLMIYLPQAEAGLAGHINHILDTFTRPATQAVFDVDKAGATNVLNGLGQYPYVQDAAIIGDDGATLASIRFHANDSVAHPWLNRLTHLDRFKAYERALQDNRFEPGHHGLLVVNIDQHAALNPLFRQLVLLGKNELLQHLLFILIVYFIVYLMVTRRLLSITALLERISPNAPNAMRIPLDRSDDEINDLSAGINRFIDASERYLHAKNEAEKSLVDLTLNLENLVRERTRDLEKTKSHAEQALEAADRANEAKSIFLSNMSHELRTPLNSIIGFTRRVMKTNDKLSEREIDGLNRVLDNSHYLLQLVNELLDIAKIESGKMELNLESVALHDIIDDCCHKLEPLAENHGIALFNCVKEPLIVIGDSQKLMQVFLNLISNGIKYTEQGSVKVEADTSVPGKLTIAVTDTGIGINPDDQRKIFDPYNHIHSNLNKTVLVESTGLGLPLAQRIVRMHGGDIKVDSAPGKGSVFRVVLPLTGTGATSVVK